MVTVGRATRDHEHFSPGKFLVDTATGVPAQKLKLSTSAGLEPTIFGSEVRRVIHYATRPWLPLVRS